MNKFVLIGNLGNDPNISYTTEKVAVTKFSLALHRYSRSASGERQDETYWFNIVAFRHLAETCYAHLRKGHRVYVAGHIQQRKQTNKDGAQRTDLTVFLKEIVSITSKGISDMDSGIPPNSWNDKPNPSPRPSPERGEEVRPPTYKQLENENQSLRSQVEFLQDQIKKMQEGLKVVPST